jgi:hypothetical protein
VGGACAVGPAASGRAAERLALDRPSGRGGPTTRAAEAGPCRGDAAEVCNLAPSTGLDHVSRTLLSSTSRATSRRRRLPGAADERRAELSTGELPRLASTYLPPGLKGRSGARTLSDL